MTGLVLLASQAWSGSEGQTNAGWRCHHDEKMHAMGGQQLAGGCRDWPCSVARAARCESISSAELDDFISSMPTGESVTEEPSRGTPYLPHISQPMGQ